MFDYPMIVCSSLLLLTLLIVFSLYFRPACVMDKREEKKERLQKSEARQKFFSRMQELCKNDKQRSAAIQWVITFVEGEHNLEKSHVDDIVSYLEKNGIRGSEFQELFQFLADSLKQNGRTNQAVYLGQKTGLQVG